MWAHCCRINAGINTNMALESLNKFLKYNLLGGNARVTVEQLLDTWDEVIEEKMWNKIHSLHRPTSDNYQDKIVATAHRRAEGFLEKVKATEFGKFKVLSSTGKNFYDVEYGSIECQCLGTVCRVCEICFHRYKCSCTEYLVRGYICKHCHMVAMFERMYVDSVSEAGSSRMDVENQLYIEEPNEIRLVLEDTISEFIEEKMRQPPEEDPESKKLVMIEAIVNRLNILSPDIVEEYGNKFLEETKKHTVTEEKNTKRKLEKQSYYPKKKNKL